MTGKIVDSAHFGYSEKGSFNLSLRPFRTYYLVLKSGDRNLTIEKIITDKGDFEKNIYFRYPSDYYTEQLFEKKFIRKDYKSL